MELISSDKLVGLSSINAQNCYLFPLQYPEIWALDAKDPFLPPEGGESVADVVNRLTRALSIVESEFEG